MKRLLPLLAILSALALAACSGGQGRKAELIISAAASLKDALTEAQTQYQSAHPDVQLRLNFGSSGALQQQIEQGAPADIFIPAAPDPMKALTARGLVNAASVHTLVTNQVVLVASGESPVKDWADLPAAGRIALGNPSHVPAGQYGKAVLQSLGLWGAVEPKLVLGEDVRQVLHYVEVGEVQAGIVYSTDAATAAAVRVVARAPAGSHPPVAYPMAVLKATRHPAEAQAFASWLLSAEARSIFTKYGFGGAE